MKHIEAIRDDGTDMFEQPRRCGFGFGDIRRAQKVFNAPLVGDEATWKDSILGRLGSLDFNVISWLLATGLNNFSKKKLDQEDADQLIENYLDGDPPGKLSDIVKLLRDALDAGRFVPKSKQDEQQQADDAPTKTARRPLEPV